ncbi:PAS domain S-box protein [Spirosoma sp. BT704]|uniref:histidine kinase n=2 Tax=Spirosoma validum TaxID=2771355 RepID=A0A927B5P2_9BACT|nr:PAS domain S-box protein [Spirosoma validum]
MIGAMQDISERVALQQAREESDDRLRFALQSAQLGTWDVDLIRGLVNWDERCKQIFGLAKSSTISYDDTLRYIHVDDQRRVQDSAKWSLNPQSGGHYQCTYRMIGDDGKLRWVRSMGQTYFTESGQPYRFSGVAQDITEEVLAREKSDLSEQQSQLALEGSGSGSFLIDLSTDAILYSPAFARILTGETTLGLTRDVFINNVHPEDRPIREKAYETGAKDGTISYEVRFVWNDQSIHWVKILGQYIFDMSGKAISFSGIALDITEQKEKARALKEAEERFSIAFANTSVGMAFADPQANFSAVNEAYTQLLGYSAEELCALNSIELTHSDDRANNLKLYEEVAQGKRPFFNLVKRYVRKDGLFRWVQMNVTRLADAQDESQSMVIIAYDITEGVEAEAKLRASEERFRNMVTQAPVAIGVLNGRNMTVETANTSMLEIWGKDASIVGLPLIEALPELQGQAFIELLEGVYTTGIAHYGFEMQAQLHRKGHLEEAYFNFVYAPIRDDGNITGVIVIATEVSVQVKAKKALQESEQRFRTLILEAPVAISLFTGRDMVVELPNEKMLKFWGKDKTAEGKPLREAVPELVGQPFLQILDTVFTTGIEHSEQEAPASLFVDGTLKTYYFNFTYKPLRNAEGEVYAVLDMATDVTEQVTARRAIEESELRFRTLMEAMSPMAWTNTPEGDVNFYNQQWYDYTGSDFEQTKDWGWQEVVHPDDLPHTLAAYVRALADGTIFVVENRYRRGSDGMYRWHLNRAVPVRDETGKITIWVGTATDIHEQKQLEADLEQQIQARTEQLVASNQDLRRSNDNLEKFAYIASHDLQEPLRKIQSFGDILKTQHTEQLGAGVDYLDRMQAAASRMSLLIRDLLTFSRISTRQERVTPVALNNVLTDVLDDLEMTIRQTEAKIEIDTLPTVLGDKSQMRQLFQNLLSNALKFQQAGVSPLIRILVETITANRLPESVKPTQSAARYHQISISDNGIGFDAKYVDRIFQVFQRLHSRNEYAGTGIGLAICEKVAANHGGAITAISQPGQGASFIIYLPVE